jgi:hypothetical protein
LWRPYGHDFLKDGTMSEQTTRFESPGTQRRIQGSEEDFASVAARLRAKFGLGDNQTLRNELYERLQRCCEDFGNAAYKIVCGAVRSSMSADHPDRYFAACVARRMREAGFFVDQVQSW